MLMAADNPQELKLELIQRLEGMQEKIHLIWLEVSFKLLSNDFNKSIKDGDRRAFNLGVSRHKAVHVVVDLLEYEASVHEGEAALREKVSEHTFFVLNHVIH